LNLPVLTIASGNQRKVSEISEMLDVLSLKVEKQPEYLNVEETGKTYFENALLKAKAASLETKTWALADDSGLEVDVLDGRPGIYSARYAKNNDEKINLRGGSDRSFLEFIQILGNEFGINNKIIFVDSSSGEVERPSTKKTGLTGISDLYDNLKFDLVFQNGPKEYISWFIELANKRSNFKKK